LHSPPPLPFRIGPVEFAEFGRDYAQDLAGDAAAGRADWISSPTRWTQRQMRWNTKALLGGPWKLLAVIALPHRTPSHRRRARIPAIRILIELS
jgi:hypothetical protein